MNTACDGGKAKNMQMDLGLDSHLDSALDMERTFDL